MYRHSRPHRSAITLAAAGALGLIASGIAQAGPPTGSGVPIDTVQPSLKVTYLVRPQDPTNFADIGQVEGFAGSIVRAASPSPTANWSRSPATLRCSPASAQPMAATA